MHTLTPEKMKNFIGAIESALLLSEAFDLGFEAT